MEDDRHQIVTELAPLGSVSDALADIEDEVAPGHQLAILQQICSGMAALASEGLVHRDLALRNVLLFVFDPDDPTAAGVCVKICDFGLTVNTYGGTHATVAGGSHSTTIGEDALGTDLFRGFRRRSHGGE